MHVAFFVFADIPKFSTYKGMFFWLNSQEQLKKFSLISAKKRCMLKRIYLITLFSIADNS